MTQIEKELRFLKIYSGALTLVCTLLLALVFKAMNIRRFDEIDVERINVIEADGQLRMVLANKKRQHPGTMDGITYQERRGERPPGLMFFSEKGDEVGGLVFDGNTGKGQGGSLTFDKFRGDQTIQFIHEEEPDGTYFAGLKMNDQNSPLNELLRRENEISQLPNKEAQEEAYRALREQGLLMTERLKIGRNSDKSSLLQMKDAKGKVRLELRVEANGDTSLKFLDGAGQVLYRLPPDRRDLGGT